MESNSWLVKTLQTPTSQTLKHFGYFLFQKSYKIQLRDHHLTHEFMGRWGHQAQQEKARPSSLWAMGWPGPLFSGLGLGLGSKPKIFHAFLNSASTLPFWNLELSTWLSISSTLGFRNQKIWSHARFPLFKSQTVTTFLFFSVTVSIEPWNQILQSFWICTVSLYFSFSNTLSLLLNLVFLFLFFIFFHRFFFLVPENKRKEKGDVVGFVDTGLSSSFFYMNLFSYFE